MPHRTLALPILAFTLMAASGVEAKRVSGKRDELSAEKGVRPITFQGFSVGDDLDVVKAAKLPNGERGPRSVGCTDQQEYAGRTALLPEDKLAGVVECFPVEMAGQSWTRASLPVGDGVSVSPELYVFKGKLARIETTYGSINSIEIFDALSTKFGPPSSRREEVIQNGAGASIPQVTASWVFPNGRVDYQAPFYSVDQMMVIYESSDAVLMDAAKKKVASGNLHL